MLKLETKLKILRVPVPRVPHLLFYISSVTPSMYFSFNLFDQF